MLVLIQDLIWEHKMIRTDIINYLVERCNATKYLEIGVWNGVNLNAIRCSYKVAVDPDPLTAATVHCTSDAFFETNSTQFDVIFIDGLHEHHQVYKDITNALKWLSPEGFIVCHDMSPVSEETQRVPYSGNGIWNGDCWKALVQIRTERSDITVETVDTDYGCGIICQRPSSCLDIQGLELTYHNFEANRRHWLNLISPEEFLLKYTL